MDRQLPVTLFMGFMALTLSLFFTAPVSAAGQSFQAAADNGREATRFKTSVKAAGATPQRSSGKATRKKQGLHGRSWAFGHSSDRNAAIWRDGVASQDLHDRAVSGALEKKAVNTARGISSALSGSAAQARKKKKPLGISMESEVSTWREPLPADGVRADEARPLESRHVVRAYADVTAGEDLSISVGPELILRDEQTRERNSNASQPESVLGMGMQFKMDF
ncbi:hypothetical protein [Desulfovibrio sp. ZJ369]|uniref:hypothetical protein n=1 Tax=Desulfovibrio sp. ZJ369 TaxID=2709793 RepID=UPI0013EB5716|nr:hypothetical protein [Desulfovibrio sp. ZJ369]